jgi:hypothetical protein
MITPTECPNCRAAAYVFWTDGPQARCETCRKADRKSYENSSVVVFAPKRDSSSRWHTDLSATFADRRVFIDECLRPATAKQFKDALIGDGDAIKQLIGQLKSNILREDDTEYARLLRALDEAIEREKIANQRIREQRQALASLQRVLRSMNWRKDDCRPVRREIRDRQQHLRRSLKETAIITEQVRTVQDQVERRRRSHASTIQQHAVERLKSEFDLWRKGELDIGFENVARRVHWEILRPSGNSWDELVRHYEYLARVRNVRYELQRLKYVYQFGADETWVGRASFEGYVVFCFRDKQLAVLECPEVGNALYLMSLDDWKPLSRLSKTELLRFHPQEVRRLLHSDHWKSELRRLLN